MSERYEYGFEDGIEAERLRILLQWQYEMKECRCEDAIGHMERRIKGEINERNKDNR